MGGDMTADPATIRAACEHVVSLAAGSQAYGPILRTAIGVDENLFHAALAPFLRRCLLDIPEVFEVGMLWNERRETATGEKLLVGGGSPTGQTGEGGQRVIAGRMLMLFSTCWGGSSGTVVSSSYLLIAA
jgi:hypothetical protein